MILCYPSGQRDLVILEDQGDLWDQQDLGCPHRLWLLENLESQEVLCHLFPLVLLEDQSIQLNQDVPFHPWIQGHL